MNKRFLNVEPIGTKKVGTLHGPIDQSFYPKNELGELLLRVGQQLDVPLRHMATALDLTVVEASGLRHGRVVPATPADFTWAVAQLVAESERLHPRKVFRVDTITRKGPKRAPR